MRWHSPPRRKSLSLRHAPGTARTCNLQFRRLSLYPVELRVLIAEPLTIGHNPGLARGKWAADFTGRHPIAYGIGHRLHRFSQIKTNAVKLSCQWLVTSGSWLVGKRRRGIVLVLVVVLVLDLLGLCGEKGIRFPHNDFVQPLR
jgi:hypothetical protein